jgi:alcohol dehydrogenase
MIDFETRPSPRLIGGSGSIARLPDAVRETGARHVLLVSDEGIVAAGHVDRAVDMLRAASVEVTVYDATHENPDETDIEAARDFASGLAVDGLIGLGGGSSMDTAKGCNFLLTNGGRMADYKGYGHAAKAIAGIRRPSPGWPFSIPS